MKAVLIVSALLIIAGTVIGVFIVERKPNDEEAYNVLSFALFSGDPKDNKYLMLFSGDLKENEVKHCSFEMNVENSIRTLAAMVDSQQRQRYVIFIYGRNMTRTQPMKTMEATSMLENISPTKENTDFEEMSAVTEFDKQLSESNSNLLVYYIPCRYQYNSEDPETRSFAQKMRKFERRILLISNTHNASTVADVYNLNIDYVVGEGDNVAERIQSFVTSATTTIATTSITSPTVVSSATSTVATTATSTVTQLPTASTLTTTSRARTSATPAPKPIPSGAHCIFCADMLNFRNESGYQEKSKYTKEKELLNAVAKILLSGTNLNNLAGLWAYGHTMVSPYFAAVFAKMRKNSNAFFNDTEDGMKYRDSPTLVDNKEVVKIINEADGPKTTNCLVFLSAVKDVSELVKFTYSPGRFKWTVVVSLREANLSSIITTEGLNINVSLDREAQQSAETVVAAIRRGFP